MTAIKTLFNLNGAWLHEGFWGASYLITRVGNNFFINMSDFGRPTATGVIVDATTIEVNFPDDSTFIGTLQKGNKIQWSSGSYWTKAKMIFKLDGIWTHQGKDGPVINGNMVSMSAYYRPTAMLTHLNPCTIQVIFPDDNIFIGTLVKPNKIKWNNFTEWIKKKS